MYALEYANTIRKKKKLKKCLPFPGTMHDPIPLIGENVHHNPIYSNQGRGPVEVVVAILNLSFFSKNLINIFRMTLGIFGWLIIVALGKLSGHSAWIIIQFVGGKQVTPPVPSPPPPHPLLFQSGDTGQTFSNVSDSDASFVYMYVTWASTVCRPVTSGVFGVVRFWKKWTFALLDMGPHPTLQ